MSIELCWNAKRIVWDRFAEGKSHGLRCKKHEPKFIARSGAIEVFLGDNASTMHALIPKYKGQCELAYLDPPYNGGYNLGSFLDDMNDDLDKQWFIEVLNIDSTTLDRQERWLSAIYARLLMVRELLSDQGTIAISIDCHQFAQMQVLVREVFAHLVGEVVFSRRHSYENGTQDVVSTCAHYLIVRSSCVISRPLLTAEWPSTDFARKQLADELHIETDCFTPKPVSLVRYLVRQYLPPGGLLLDPYAGTGVSGRAVLDENARDGGHRRAVLIERNSENVDVIVRRLH